MPAPRIEKILNSPSCPKSCDISPRGVPQGVAAVECRQARYVYHDGKEAVAGTSFLLEPGESAALCGPNGSGKTTLLKMIAGLLPATSGSVWLAGEQTTPQNEDRAYRSVGFLFQDSQDQVFCDTVEEDVAYGLRGLDISPQEAKARVSLALHLTEAEHLARKPVHHLSGGELKRVALAGLLVMRTPVLILDEPTAGLDPASKEHFLELIPHLHRDHGYTFLIVTHEMDLVPLLAQRLLILHQGRLMADGPVRELLSDIPLMERASLRAPAITTYFYEKAVQEGKRPERLPLTIQEALERGSTL